MSAVLLIKLTFTPFMMWAVSKASRKWGGAVGGLLAGLPITSGPISIYLALEQGYGFAAEAAVNSISGVTATIVFYVVYALSGKRRSAGWTLAIALVAFFASIAILRYLHLSLATASAVCAIALVVSLLVCRTGDGIDGSRTYSRWDIPARMIVSTALVVVMTASAPLIGPAMSGLLSPIPAVSRPLIVFAHRQQGHAEAMKVMRGSLQGAIGILVFYVIVALFLPKGAGVATYCAALGGSVLVVTGWMIGGRPSAPPKPCRDAV